MTTVVWAGTQAEAFLRALELKPASSETIAGYARDLRQFLRHIEGDSENRVQLLFEAGRRFVRAQFDRGLHPRTIGRRVACLHTFGAYLVEEKLLPTSPFETLQTPKAPKTLPRWIAVDDIRRLLAGIASHPHRVMLTVFVRCGARVGEIAKLEIESVLRGPRQLRLMGKGRKERPIPLTDDTLALLEVHIVLLGSTRGPLFPSRMRGPDGRRRPLSTSQIRRIVYGYTRAILGNRLNPHALRHGFGTALAEAGVPLQDIQELMGHASPATTMRYLHMAGVTKRRAIERLEY